MNIGIFTDTYFPQISGVATSTKMLARELNKLGHKVYIFTTDDPKAEKTPYVFRLPSMPFLFLPSRRVAYLYPPKLLLKMKSLDLDIIHTQTEFPMGIFGRVVAEFLSIPTVHTYHTMYEDYVHYVANGKLISPNAAKQYVKLFCKGAKTIITPVEKAKKRLVEFGVSKDIQVVPSGIDFTPFQRGKYSQEEINAAKEALGLNLTDPIVITVGRVAREKSIDVTLKQMPKLLELMPEAKFVIVGDGPYLKDLKAMAKSLSVENAVIFAGPQPWDSIGLYYQMGDVFVTASTSETQGLTHIEAMAAGVPVIVKKDLSFEAIVLDQETGLVFKQDEELTHCIYRVLSDKSFAQKLVEGAYEIIKPLSCEEFAKRILEIYIKTLERHSPPRTKITLTPLINKIRVLKDFTLRRKNGVDAVEMEKENII